MESTLTVSRELKIYFAGLVDGEGSISIFNNNSNGQLSLRVNVTNTFLPVLQLLRSFYGGALNKKPRSKLTHKECWTWDVKSKKARIFLEDIAEWLIIKKGQAEIAFRFLETFEENKRSYGMNSKRQSLKEEMTKLNHLVN